MAIFFSDVKTRLLRGETARKDSSTGFFNILLENAKVIPVGTDSDLKRRCCPALDEDGIFDQEVQRETIQGSIGRGPHFAC